MADCRATQVTRKHQGAGPSVPIATIPVTFPKYCHGRIQREVTKMVVGTLSRTDRKPKSSVRGFATAEFTMRRTSWRNTKIGNRAKCRIYKCIGVQMTQSFSIKKDANRKATIHRSSNLRCRPALPSLGADSASATTSTSANTGESTPAITHNGTFCARAGGDTSVLY